MTLQFSLIRQHPTTTILLVRSIMTVPTNALISQPKGEEMKDKKKKEEMEEEGEGMGIPLALFLLTLMFFWFARPADPSFSHKHSLRTSWLKSGQQKHLKLYDAIHYTPEQLHLSLGANGTELCVTWSTLKPVRKAELIYSLSYGLYGRDREEHKLAEMSLVPISDLDSKWANASKRTWRNLYTYRATVSGLTPDVESFIYRADSLMPDTKSGGMKRYSSKIYQYLNKDLANPKRTISVALFGDLGLINGQSVPRLIKDVDENKYDLIIHNGDFAYDLDTNLGQYGDEFMRMIEPIAARVPYQTSVGNHEIAANFSHYDSRFTMVNRGGPTPGERNNHYYSFNVGPVHFVAFSTEFYYYLHRVGRVALENQYKWLERDLKMANSEQERAKRPWIIVFGHRPMYCSSNDGDDCSRENILRQGIGPQGEFALEKLFYDHQVDVEFYSHEHQYERFLPIYNGQVMNGTEEAYLNPRAPVHVISGSAGCQERLDPFRKQPAVGSVVRSSDYGYTQLKATPCSLDFKQISDDAMGDSIDSFSIKKRGKQYSHC